jgi:hypothetical protein
VIQVSGLVVEQYDFFTADLHIEKVAPREQLLAPMEVQIPRILVKFAKKAPCR